MCSIKCTCPVVSSHLSIHPICNTVCLSSAYNLGQKVLGILHFLTQERPSRGFGTSKVPPLTPPWSKLNSRDQK